MSSIQTGPVPSPEKCSLISGSGGHDYRLDAKLDLHQFTAIIIRCVLHYNNRHYMDGYARDMQMRWKRQNAA